MREELGTILKAIESSQLPSSASDFLKDIWDQERQRFHVQETYVLDFKDRCPDQFSSDYGVGIARLAIAFHNTYGGVIIFGVEDRTLRVMGIQGHFNVEAFNRYLSDVTGKSIECVYKRYSLTIDGTLRDIAVILVPRRKFEIPMQTIAAMGKYPAGIIWIRDRHEVLRAEPRHMPLLFSERTLNVSLDDSSDRFPVHRSFPPSPATVKEFINRGNILNHLWRWFLFGDQPRLYLHGPGGSGKSTLAFEFARMLAESGYAIKAKNGDRLDYVIYLSAKEVELNTLTGKQQSFLLRNFSSAEDQLRQILFHSGFLKEADVQKATTNDVDALLSELMDNFSGLIVIDDIDSLSRRQVDTGEETLFIKTVTAKKRTRILYTLRFPPAHALGSALPVPGLDETHEIFEFIEACSKQFEVAQPPAEKIPHITSKTSSLPLLVETIVGLRKFTSNYTEALEQFDQKGGDEARRYLYQREYDRLDNSGKARQVLAGLFLLEEPVTFTTLTNLFQFTPEQVREAISECASIFLSAFENEDGQTLYQLTPPAVPFIARVSESLFYFNKLKTLVSHFRNESHASAEERALIVKLRNLIRGGRYSEMIATRDQYSPSDSVLLNPEVQSLVGQAFAELGPDFREHARQCFKHAEGLGYRDGFMMRRWFHMEFQSGYGLQESEEICLRVIKDQKMSARIRSEFWSKLGSCHLKRAESLLNVTREKGIEHLKDSVVCYLEGLWVGSTSDEMKLAENLIWIERPLHRLILDMRSDIEIYFDLFDRIIQRKHDVDVRGISILIDYLTRSQIPADSTIKQKVRGGCMRIAKKIERSFRDYKNLPGMEKLHSTMTHLAASL